MFLGESWGTLPVLKREVVGIRTRNISRMVLASFDDASDRKTTSGQPIVDKYRSAPHLEFGTRICQWRLAESRRTVRSHCRRLWIGTAGTSTKTPYHDQVHNRAILPICSTRTIPSTAEDYCIHVSIAMSTTFLVRLLHWILQGTRAGVTSGDAVIFHHNALTPNTISPYAVVSLFLLFNANSNG